MLPEARLEFEAVEHYCNQGPGAARGTAQAGGPGESRALQTPRQEIPPADSPLQVRDISTVWQKLMLDIETRAFPGCGERANLGCK